MKCALETCQKPIPKASKKEICNRCSSIFCSLSCLTYHIDRFHEPTSPFLVKGDFALSTPEWPASFDLYNFDMNSREKIGRGAFGEIYTVRHIPSGKYYAIKIMNKKKVIETGADLSIIKSEIAVHIRLTHPFIVKLVKTLKDKRFIYLIFCCNNIYFILLKI